MDISIESLLALIGELYVKNRLLENRLEEKAKEEEEEEDE